VRLTPDPIPLTVIVGCRKHLPPELIATGPSWATIGNVAGTLDPLICHPKPSKARWPWLLAGIGVGMIGWEIAR
jgi:hypothetical protein